MPENSTKILFFRFSVKTRVIYSWLIWLESTSISGLCCLKILGISLPWCYVSCLYPHSLKPSFTAQDKHRNVISNFLSFGIHGYFLLSVSSSISCKQMRPYLIIVLRGLGRVNHNFRAKCSRASIVDNSKQRLDRKHFSIWQGIRLFFCVLFLLLAIYNDP